MIRPEIILAMNDLFKNEAPRLMQELKKAANDNDLSEAGKIAHALGGGARRINARILTDLCTAIEHEARNGNPTEVIARLPELDDAYFNALHEATKSSIDHRIENVEGELKELRTAFVEGVSELKTALLGHLIKQEQMLATQIQATKELIDVIEANFKTMVDALTGKNQMPTTVVGMVVKILGGVVVALLAVLVFLLTGMRFNLLPMIAH
jgi:HPt (histidine-containing phosphotransfer) domain-containing protein